MDFCVAPKEDILKWLSACTASPYLIQRAKEAASHDQITSS